MGTYIQTADWYDSCYVVGKPSLRTKYYARLAKGGSLPVKLSSRYDYVMEFETGIGMLMIGLIASVILLAIGFGLHEGGHTVAASVLAWIAAIGGGLSMIIPVLSGLYYALGGLVDNRSRPTSYWSNRMREQDRVFSVGDQGSRPAIKALGGPGWFSQYGNEYGDEIDEFLTDAEVLQAERLLKEEGIRPDLRERTERELERLARGAITAHTDALEHEAEVAEGKARQLEIDSREARAAKANELLEKLLDETLASRTTPEEIFGDDDLR